MFARVEEEEEALPRRCRDIEYLEIYVRAKFSKVLFFVKNNSPLSSRAKSTHYNTHI